MKRTAASLSLALLALVLVAAPAGAKGSPIVDDAIWADGSLHGTILLGDLPYRDNAHSFDQLFMVPGQAPVSEAAPGNPGYNGGRWLPTPVTWNTDPYLLTSYAEVMAAVAAGHISLGSPMTDAAFLCPLIK